MRKILVYVLALTMLLTALSGCGGQEASGNSSGDESIAESLNASSEAESEASTASETSEESDGTSESPASETEPDESGVESQPDEQESKPTETTSSDETSSEETSTKPVKPECSHSSNKVVNAKDATCTADGYSGDTVCSSCGKTVKSGSAIKAKGHTPELKNKKDATFASEGYTGDKVCTVCGVIVEKGKAVPKNTELSEEEIADMQLGAKFVMDFSQGEMAQLIYNRTSNDYFLDENGNRKYGTDSIEISVEDFVSHVNTELRDTFNIPSDYFNEALVAKTYADKYNSSKKTVTLSFVGAGGDVDASAHVAYKRYFVWGDGSVSFYYGGDAKNGIAINMSYSESNKYGNLINVVLQ